MHCSFVHATAQESAQERAANLRAQLVETQAKQAELQTQMQQVEEDLKPENIERSLAGVGSTRPEEFREARRRQLEIQKKSMQSQLDLLDTSRLEAAIASADAEIYRQNAGVALTTPTQTNNQGTSSNSIRRQKKHRVKRRK